VMTLPSLCLVVIFSAETGKGPAPFSGAGGAAALSSSPPSPSASAPSPAPLASLSAAALPPRLDALYAQRDDRRVLAEQLRFLDERAQQADASYELLWRAARLYFWLGDDPSQSADERSKIGKIGWDYAERAIALAPHKADGYYWAAVNMG